MIQNVQTTRWGAVLGAGVLACTASLSSAANLAVFDVDLFDASGYTYTDFSPAGVVDTSSGYISIDLQTDSDGNNGLFGGLGADVTAWPVDFDPSNAQLEVTLRVDATNVASEFRVVLTDLDGTLNAEDYQFNFNIASVTPGSFVTLTQNLTSPGPVYSQTTFGYGPGDGIQNYGLKTVQVQSVFAGTDPLVIDIDTIKIVDPDDPTIARLDAATYDGAFSSFTFGSMSSAGAVVTTSGNIVVDAELQAGGDFPGTSFGGLGVEYANVDFEATEAELVVNAKLLANNDASTFNVLLSDEDPDGAGDDFIFSFDTTDFNTTDFTEVVIPLGSGSESGVTTTYGLNPGDMLQNFGLIKMQLQTEGESATSRLNIEIESIEIRELTVTNLPGDLNGDGFVGLDDLDIILSNWNLDVPPADAAADPTGDGFVGLADLDIVLNNWNTGTPPNGSAIPEPASFTLLSLGGLVVLWRRGSFS